MAPKQKRGRPPGNSTNKRAKKTELRLIFIVFLAFLRGAGNQGLSLKVT